MKPLSCVPLFVTPWTVAYQAPPSMGFSRQEYWSGLPFPSLGDLPHPGIEPRSPALQADGLPSEPPGKPYSFRIRINFVVTTLFNFHGILVLWRIQSYQWWIYFMKTIAFKIQIWCFKNWEHTFFPGGSVVKNLPAMQKMWTWSLGWENSLEKEMATHSTIFAWESPWTEKPGGLQSMGSQKSPTGLANNNSNNMIALIR